MALATLTIDLVAKLANLERDMGRAAHLSEQAAKRMEGAFKQVGGAIKLVGGTLSVGAITAWLKGGVDMADNLNDLSKSTGLLVGQLAGLQLAAKQSGGDLDSIANALNKLSLNMGKNAEKFAALGVTAKDPLKAFQQLSDLFVSIQAPQQRAAVMAEALGKSWAGAAPLLAEGSKRIGEMVEKGERLSGMNKELAAGADEFNDKMAELNTTLEGVRIKLVGDMLPSLNNIASAMQLAAEKGGLLEAALVGIGGLMSEGVAGWTGTRTRVEQITKALEENRSAMQNALYWGEKLDKVGLWTNKEAELASYTNRMIVLEKELEKLQAKPKTSGVTEEQAMAKAQAMYAAAKKAAAFIKDDPKKTNPFDAVRSDLGRREAEMNAQLQSNTRLTETYKHALGILEQVGSGKLKLKDIEKIELSVRLENLLALDKEVQERLRVKEATAAQMDVMRGLSGEFDRNLDVQKRAMEIMPESARKLAEELDRVEKVSESARASATKYFTDGKLSADEYFFLLERVTNETGRQSESVKQLADAQERLNSQWQYGAASALQKYSDDISNVAKTTEGMVVNAFKGMEDALVSFATTGKLDFASLADSIIADLIRIQIQQSVMPGITQIIAQMSLSGAGGGMSGMPGNTPVMSPDYWPGPSFAVGTDYVPYDMVAKIHQGERIVPAAQNKGGGVVVNVIESSSQAGQVQQRTEGGINFTDVFVSQVRAAVASDISRGGDISVALSRTYGLNRGGGAIR